MLLKFPVNPFCCFRLSIFLNNKFVIRSKSLAKLVLTKLMMLTGRKNEPKQNVAVYGTPEKNIYYFCKRCVYKNHSGMKGRFSDIFERKYF